MLVKNNSKNFKFNFNTNIKYSINEFLSLDMFNPINQKNYFDIYDLDLFGKKNLELMYLAWVDLH